MNQIPCSTFLATPAFKLSSKLFFQVHKKSEGLNIQGIMCFKKICDANISKSLMTFQKPWRIAFQFLIARRALLILKLFFCKQENNCFLNYVCISHSSKNLGYKFRKILNPSNTPKSFQGIKYIMKVGVSLSEEFCRLLLCELSAPKATIGRLQSFKTIKYMLYKNIPSFLDKLYVSTSLCSTSSSEWPFIGAAICLWGSNNCLLGTLVFQLCRQSQTDRQTDRQTGAWSNGRTNREF